MMETLFYYADYYLNVLIALCGFDGSAGSDTVGWAAVIVSLALVIAAFYIGISRAIWPGETDPQHIKYRVLDDEEEYSDAH